MSILERLIEKYENEQEISVDDLLAKYLDDDPEYGGLGLDETIEIKRQFIDYVNLSNKYEEIEDEKELSSGLEINEFRTCLQYREPRKKCKPHLKYVEAFIANISVTDSLDELWKDYLDGNNVQLLIQDIERDRCTNWTVPSWAKQGDIVLFMHARSARSKLTSLRTQIKKGNCPAAYDRERIKTAIEEQLAVYGQYGGKIFAIGQINGQPEYDDDNSQEHYFRSRVHCDVNRLFLLNRPLDLVEFDNFAPLNRGGAITPVYGDRFERLKALIMDKNLVSEYFRYRCSTPFPHNAVNSKNWIKLGLGYRNSFTLENQFRHCYVDYLLSELGDQKKIYAECACIKDNRPDTYVDNVIRISNRLLPVEVKLNMKAVSDMEGQCNQYCCLNNMVLEKKKDENGDTKYTRYADMVDVIDDKVLVIDTFQVSIYDYATNEISSLFDLGKLKEKSDIRMLRERVLQAI